MTNRYPDYDRDRYGRRWEEESDRYGRSPGGRGRDDRGFFDRAGDEEAERRRRMDEREGYTGGSYPGEFGRSYGRESYGREGYGGGGWSSRTGYGSSTEPYRGYGGYPGYSGRESYRGGWGREQTHGAERFGGETAGWGREGSLGREGSSNRESGYGSESSFGREGYGGGSFRSGYGSNYSQRYGTQTRGRFAGRGPASYQRSDDRIREDINDRLTDHPDLDATNIEVTVRQAEVTLSGSVDDRYAKRLAEDIAESVTGVKDVQNHIRVAQESEWRTSGETGVSDQEKGKRTTKIT